MSDRNNRVETVKRIWPEWTVGKRIGRGSFGEVYELVRGDLGFESRAAVKIISIPPDESEVESLRLEGMTEENIRDYYEKLVDSFAEEIRTMESLKGAPHIVALEDFKMVEEPDALSWTILIRMELLTPFLMWIREHPLNEDETIRLGTELCAALDICHQQNIIHRDIKPQNIFVDRFGSFKLGDFGIARKMEGMTSGMSQKGTFGYIAPEVSNSLLYDTRADLYSLGLVMYQQVNAGRLPFLENPAQMLNPRLRAEAIRERLSGAPLPPPCAASPELTEIIMKACRYDQEDRYHSAEEMLADLQRLALMRSGFDMTAAGIRPVAAVPPIPPRPEPQPDGSPDERLAEPLPEPDDDEKTVSSGIRPGSNPAPKETGKASPKAEKRKNGRQTENKKYAPTIVLLLLLIAAIPTALFLLPRIGIRLPFTAKQSGTGKADDGQVETASGYEARIQEFESYWEPVYTAEGWKNWKKTYSWKNAGEVYIEPATSDAPATLVISSDEPEQIACSVKLNLEKNTIYRVRAEIKFSDFKRYKLSDSEAMIEPSGCSVFFDSREACTYYHRFVRSSKWTESSLIFDSEDRESIKIGVLYGNINGFCTGEAKIRDFVVEKYTGDPDILFGSPDTVGYQKVSEAADSIGTKAITVMSYVSGSPQYHADQDEDASCLFDSKRQTKYFTDTMPCAAQFRLNAARKIDGIIFCTAEDESQSEGRLPYLWTLFGIDETGTEHEICTGDASVFRRNASDNEYFAVRAEADSEYDTYVLKVWGSPSGLFQMASVFLCVG